MKKTWTALIHGGSGVGKSWLCDTMPAPRLILDAEGRAKYLPSEPKVSWDPLREEPPAPGDWVTCVVTVPTAPVLDTVYNWLRAGNHCFRSVGVDSLMEIQKRMVDDIVGTNPLMQQDWGTLLRRMEASVRKYRDLTMFTDNPVEVVVFTVGTVEIDGKYKPLLQGQLRETIPYYMDSVGYMYNEMDEGQLVRRLLVQPVNGFVAKDGTGKLLGPVITTPNIEQMVSAL